MKFGVIRFPGSCDEVDAALGSARVEDVRAGPSPALSTSPSLSNSRATAGTVAPDQIRCPRRRISLDYSRDSGIRTASIRVKGLLNWEND